MKTSHNRGCFKYVAPKSLPKESHHSGRFANKTAASGDAAVEKCLGRRRYSESSAPICCIELMRFIISACIMACMVV